LVDQLNIKLIRIRKVLITGGLGFLGSYISKLLIKKKKKKNKKSVFSFFGKLKKKNNKKKKKKSGSL